MAKFNTLQSSFSSGMVSPKFNGRSDLDIYSRAVEELVNMYPTPEGGARAREAFRVIYQDYSVSAHQYCTKQTLIPYVDSQGKTYIIVYKYFSNSDAGQFDIYEYQGNAILSRISYVSGIEVAANIALIKNNKIQWAYVGDAVVLTYGTGEPLVIYRKPDNFSTFTISLLGFFSTENSVASLGSNKLHDASRAMSFYSLPTNTNKNYLLSGSEKVAATASTHAIWELIIKDSAGTTLAAWNVDKTTHVIISNSTYTAIFKTLGGNALNTTSAMRAYLIYARGTVAITNEKSWRVSAWDNINGYPKCVGYANLRLLLGNTNKFPSSFWCSASNNITRFNNIQLYEDSSSDASGLNTTNDIGQSTSPFGILQGGTSSFSSIKWILNGPSGFYVGTSNGVELWTSGSNGSFTSSNNYNSQLTNEGCSNIQPVGFSGNLIYVARDGKRLIMMSSEGKTTDLTSLNSELISKLNAFEKIQRIIVNESNATIIIRTDYNNLYGIKYNTIESSWGIFSIDISSIENKSSYGMDICFAESDWPSMMVMLIQKRSTGNYAQIGLGSIYTNESQAKHIYMPNLDFNFVFGVGDGNKVITLPNALRYTSNAVAAWYEDLDNPGKWYMEVFPFGSYTTTITLQKKPSANCVLGFIFTQRIKSLDIDVKNGVAGTNFGSLKRIDHVSFRVWNTSNFYFGSSDTVGETIVVSDENSSNTFSGLLDLAFQASPDRDTRLIIESRNGLPLNISSLVYKGLSSE